MERMLKFAFLAILLAALAAAQKPPTPTPTAPIVKYWVEHHDEADFASVHLTQRLAGERFSSFTFVSDRLDGKETKAVPPLFRALQDVQGITDVLLDQYKVRVQKGSAFYWNEILPDVLKIIEKHIGKLEFRAPELPPPPCPDPKPADKPGNKV